MDQVFLKKFFRRECYDMDDLDITVEGAESHEIDW